MFREGEAICAVAMGCRDYVSKSTGSCAKRKASHTGNEVACQSTKSSQLKHFFYSYFQFLFNFHPSFPKLIKSKFLDKKDQGMHISFTGG